MRIFSWVTGLGLLGLALSASATSSSLASTPKAKANACVECHRALKTDNKYIKHSFEDWEKSPHAKANVSCQDCHEGNPQEHDVMAAHKDILRSTLPASPVHFQNIPETCGKCHAEELKSFKHSKHFNELHRTGRGPSCTTCHGTMSTSTLSPEALEETCTLCHRNPMGAQSALLVMNKATELVKADEAGVTKVKAAGKDTAVLDKQLLEAKGDLKQAKQGWHSFNISDSKHQSNQALSKAKDLQKNLEKYYAQ